MPQANLTAQLLGHGGATADSYNRVSVNTPALLFNNAGAGIEASVNKAAAANDADYAIAVRLLCAKCFCGPCDGRMRIGDSRVRTHDRAQGKCRDRALPDGE